MTWSSQRHSDDWLARDATGGSHTTTFARRSRELVLAQRVQVRLADGAVERLQQEPDPGDRGCLGVELLSERCDVLAGRSGAGQQQKALPDAGVVHDVTRCHLRCLGHDGGELVVGGRVVQLAVQGRTDLLEHGCDAFPWRDVVLADGVESGEQVTQRSRTHVDRRERLGEEAPKPRMGVLEPAGLVGELGGGVGRVDDALPATGRSRARRRSHRAGPRAATRSRPDGSGRGCAHWACGLTTASTRIASNALRHHHIESGALEAPGPVRAATPGEDVLDIELRVVSLGDRDREVGVAGAPVADCRHALGVEQRLDLTHRDHVAEAVGRGGVSHGDRARGGAGTFMCQLHSFM